MIRAILHADRNWGIGKKNDLMFSLPADMKFFRETTSGKTVICGENTLFSFPNGKPLKNRLHLVLTQGAVESEEGKIIAVHSLDELLEKLAELGGDGYVIGGGSVYRQLLPYCGEVLLTKVDADGGAEVFFPNLDEHPDFVCVDEGEPIEDNGYTIRFTVYRNLRTLPIE